MKTVYIYTLEHPITKEIRYVGKTKNPKMRFHNHCNKLHNEKSHKRNWINKLKKEGLKPKMKILDEVLESEWKFWERFWINQFKQWNFNLVNHTSGGDGLTLGNETSFKKGNIPWNYGKSFSQETKDKISASLLGVKNKPLCPVIQMDLEGNFIEEFESITEASIKTNSSLSKICSVCKGNRKSTNNFKWKYK